MHENIKIFWLEFGKTILEHQMKPQIPTVRNPENKDLNEHVSFLIIRMFLFQEEDLTGGRYVRSHQRFVVCFLSLFYLKG